MALCSSDYDFDQGLHIQIPDESDTSIPNTLPQAREINLFIESVISSPDKELSLLAINQLPPVVNGRYSPPDRPVFHPPATV